jgi:tRNA dimethylallyltransferase
VVIAGATAVGKTDAGMVLAKHYRTVILSADSRQFYKELNIGTAKPDVEKLEAVHHYFINNKNITELYGAGHYEKDVMALLPDLFKKHDLVLMVGGSGLYIDAVLNGIDTFSEIPVVIREELNAEFNRKGINWLKNEVKKADAEFFAVTDTNNPQRLLRALEVTRYTGKPFSQYLKGKKAVRDFKTIKILINTSREKLYEKINLRVDAMLREGLVDEALKLLPYKNHNALKTVGYKELYEYLEGKHDMASAVSLIKQHTRNYAKRQLTWFRNKDQFKEFGPQDTEGIIEYIDEQMKADHS